MRARRRDNDGSGERVEETMTRAMLTTLALPALLMAMGCASTGATFRSGVGDRYLEHPPWSAGASTALVRADSSRIGHLPIAFQRGSMHPGVFDPTVSDESPLGGCSPR